MTITALEDIASSNGKNGWLHITVVRPIVGGSSYCDKDIVYWRRLYRHIAGSPGDDYDDDTIFLPTDRNINISLAVRERRCRIIPTMGFCCARGPYRRGIISGNQ